MDLSKRFELKWNFDNLLEKKKKNQMDLLGFLRIFSIYFESEWLFIRFSYFVNSRDIGEYLKMHLKNRCDSIFIWRKEGSKNIDLSYNGWISLWLINMWYSKSSLLIYQNYL